MPGTKPPTGLTTELARHVEGLELASVPDAARHAAKRALVNIIGCCVGGARHEIVETAVRALLPFGGAPTSGLLGRAEHTDALSASYFNALSSAATLSTTPMRRPFCIPRAPSPRRCWR